MRCLVIPYMRVTWLKKSLTVFNFLFAIFNFRFFQKQLFYTQIKAKFSLAGKRNWSSGCGCLSTLGRWTKSCCLFVLRLKSIFLLPPRYRVDWGSIWSGKYPISWTDPVPQVMTLCNCCQCSDVCESFKAVRVLLTDFQETVCFKLGF